MKNQELKSFKDLKVWQKSADLAASIYSITEEFPKSEIYGITNQMRRAVISISSNIAEGFKRQHKKEKEQFYNIAHSSTIELESQIEISKILGFSKENDYKNLLDKVIEISKMIYGLKKSLNSQSSILNSGFTIVELLVAMGLFVVLIGISAGGFIKALQTQKAIIGLMEANDNASLALEQMAREIRMGYNFSKISETEIQFVNQRNQVVWYRLNAGAIERGTEKGGVVSQRIYKKITADNVKIMNFKVVLFGANVGDGFPPRITISLSVGPTGRYLENILTNIQTTISARTLDT